ncbi:MAG: hypothetical protein V4591_03180 [Bdellovibrionota bacterium]
MSKKLLVGLCSVVFSAATFAETDPCSTLADLTSKSSPNTFVGFGAGTTQKAADDAAQIDLASRIRQKVTATSTVTENNDSSKLEATSKSVVSESLIGAKVLRRCPNSGTFSTAVSLEKSLFISALENKLSSNVDKAKKFIGTINSTKNDDIIAQNIDKAKKFIADYQSTFESDLQLCKTYAGCAAIKDTGVFSDLTDLVAKQGDKDQYLMVTNNNEVTDSFRDELIDLVEKDGTKVMDGVVGEGETSTNRKILAKCSAKVGSKIPGTSDKVVETTCVLESYIGKQKGFRKVYSCKAMADADISKEDAINSCSGRLEPAQ